MRLEYVPLLRVQRKLYDLRRGMDRFRQYIRTMVDESGELRLSLSGMNPMGKEHVAAFLDVLLAMEADDVAAAAAAEAAGRLPAVDAIDFCVTLIVSDDRMGGWTNRTAAEYEHRFGERGYHRRGWVTGVLWTIESYTAAAIAEEVITAIARAAYVAAHGPARTLRAMLDQEGYAMRVAEARTSWLDAADLAYTREIITPLLSSDPKPTVVAALFGDDAARDLGYSPLGLSSRAGLALARSDHWPR